MNQTVPTETTADTPDGPAGSEEAAVASFARLLAAEKATERGATIPSPSDEPEEPAESPEADEPAEEEEAPDESEEESEVEEVPPQEPTYTVKVDGKVLEVPASELVKGYQRFADYTRKTTEVAAERKALEAELQSLSGVREEYAKRIDQLAAALKETEGEPNWEQLKATDPIGFATQFAEWQIKAQQRQAIQQEQQRVQEEQARMTAHQRQQYLQAEQAKLLEAVPEWKDAAKAKAEHQQILDYAKSQGFRDEELAEVYDSRLVLLLRDAARYHQLAAKVKATPVPQNKAPTASPTVTPKGMRPPVSDLTKQKQRLAKTGRAEDAVPIFLAAMKKK
jgi:hypothetical protein